MFTKQNQSASVLDAPAEFERGRALGVTAKVGAPAMQLGVTDHVWSISELVDAALSGALPQTAAWDG